MNDMDDIRSDVPNSVGCCGALHIQYATYHTCHPHQAQEPPVLPERHCPCPHTNLCPARPHSLFPSPGSPFHPILENTSDD